MKSSLRMSHLKKMSVAKVYQFFVVMAATIIFASCQKEVSGYPGDGNAAQSASSANSTAFHVDAGPEKIVIYPACTSTTLFANCNSQLVNFKWMQISGPSTSAIAQPNSRITFVSSLKPGIYTFVLTATDNNGISCRDTTSVSVLQKMSWTVNGITREALVHFSSGTGPAPIIFAFHGHGGTDIGFSSKGFELDWPQAIVVYPQGLPTKSHEDQFALKPGWQHFTGEINTRTNAKDQDLQFFDAMLSTFENQYNANSKCVFVHGWSNGGSFVYNVLWAARGNKLAGISSSAATLNTTYGKAPLPVIQIAGKSDPLVSFNGQQQSMQKVCTLNQCYPVGSLWAQGDNGVTATRYWSPLHKPVMFIQYDGGHSYPSNVDPLVVKFFKQIAWRIIFDENLR